MASTWMDRALDEAETVRGRTAPNPPVGAIIVRDGTVVGAGATQSAGGPHAEVVALRNAGRASHGATLYCTLEPCCHYGRTPPCTEAIIAAGIYSVIVAIEDPNPLVAGQGLRALRQAGITVSLGDGANEALAQLTPFVTSITTGLPYVTAKWAMTLDGKIATRTGDARWISGEAARAWVHNLRDTVDAIVVGAGTVVADDPRLTVRRTEHDGYPIRTPRPDGPLRVVLDSRLRIPLDCALLSPEQAPGTLLVTTEQAPPDKREAVETRGAGVVLVPPTEHGAGVDVGSVFRELAWRGALHVLIEGGASVFGSAFEAGCINHVAAFIAPRIAGGSGAPSAVGGRGIAMMADALSLEHARGRCLGNDTLIEAIVEYRNHAWAPRRKETHVHGDR